jgi:alkylation response protein AidB-like acyl-CoA dehydrogenase
MTTLSAIAEPRPTHHELVAQARELAIGFRARADHAEQARRLPEASIAEMVDAGFPRVLVPSEYGGLERDAITWFEVVREVARGDASHGWCASLMMHHAHYVSLFPEAAQQAVWEESPNVVISASLAPTSKITVVDGGYRISGKAGFASGVSGASWVIVGGLLHGDSPPQWTWFLVSSDQYTVEETWFTSGMRGTGSNTVVTDDIFVPTERALAQTGLANATAPGCTMHSAAIYRAPWAMYAPLTFVTPMLGGAQAAYQHFVDGTIGRHVETGQSVADLAHVQVKVGRVAALLDCAEGLMRRIAEAIDAGAITEAEQARAVRDYSFAAELCLQAIDQLLALSGAAGFVATNPIQRAWRDIHFASTHRALIPELNFAFSGRYELGISSGPREG